MPTRTGAPNKYDPLLHYLQALAPEREQVTVTFTAIEALIGSALPASAWTGMFWGNNSYRPSAWRVAGFRARLLRYPGAPSVEFRRLQQHQERQG